MATIVSLCDSVQAAVAQLGQSQALDVQAAADARGASKAASLSECFARFLMGCNPAFKYKAQQLA